MLIVLATLSLLTDLVRRSCFTKVTRYVYPGDWRPCAAAVGMLVLLTLMASEVRHMSPGRQTGIARAPASLSRVAYGTTEPPATSLGTAVAKRSISAVLVASAQNFNDPDVVVMLIVGALLVMVALVITGGEIGKRNRPK